MRFVCDYFDEVDLVPGKQLAAQWAAASSPAEALSMRAAQNGAREPVKVAQAAMLKL